MSEQSSWSINDACQLYRINNWGHDYFEVTQDGHVGVYLNSPKGKKLCSLYEMVEGLDSRGINMPVLLRFPDLIQGQIKELNENFRKAIKEYEYNGVYRGVYPIKVNQQEQVVEQVVNYGVKYHHGLEAGSKAELLIALAYIKDPESYIVCNGYKDAEFIDLALWGCKLGLPVFLVAERPGEIETIIRRSRALNISPNIGIRAKLSSTVEGKWAESAGDHSIFGLTSSQMVEALDTLKNENMLQHLKLLHYHLGSQIPKIRSVRKAVDEATRYYISLVQEGAPMGILDIGGGLGVDYDGSKAANDNSRNYSLMEYCADVIEVVKKNLDDAQIDHPNIITESGRAISAYSSVLLFNILDTNSLTEKGMPSELPDGMSQHLEYLFGVHKDLNENNLQESYHDAIYYRDEIRNLFQVGKISLRERALGDEIFWATLKIINQHLGGLERIPDELQNIEKNLSEIYYANFSVFQSLPDAWAIDQLFPVMPIHRLEEKPSSHAILADITCDCDGKVSNFIDDYRVKPYLPLHNLDKKPYIVGVFLVGAYQETLGDLHNLFGDTNVVGVTLANDGEIEYKEELAGDSVEDVLSYVEYDIKFLKESFRQLAESGVRQKLITGPERRHILEVFDSGLRGYTYFEEN
ncbi:biosynthetic arginine decarboxylase [Spirochaeta cellobiosiphila]|uniref:biosynthetic arginine decarboxylase n=1 Tax=Spirochaeta cellobiosiphila TaxID=504483 RepID=UPI000401071E|nr:biosynthetic arginine decarboxylase [Spirochaeta cellobiosiphila]